MIMNEDALLIVYYFWHPAITFVGFLFYVVAAFSIPVIWCFMFDGEIKDGN